MAEAEWRYAAEVAMALAEARAAGASVVLIAWEDASGYQWRSAPYGSTAIAYGVVAALGQHFAQPDEPDEDEELDGVE